jgi:hypothetical protein
MPLSLEYRPRAHQVSTITNMVRIAAARVATEL